MTAPTNPATNSTLKSNSYSLFLRIDDRLIHGQVVTTWVRALGTRSIWVVSDRAAAEPLEVILLKSSVPTHLSLDVFGVEVAIQKLTQAVPEKTLILLERIEDVAAICAKCPFITEVNLGGLRYRPGKVGITRSVYVLPDEVTQLKQLDARGVKVFIQIVPSDSKVLAVDKID